MGAKIRGLFQPSSQGLSISHKKRYPGNEVGFICNFVFNGAAFQRDHFPKSIIVLNISAENKRLQKDILAREKIRRRSNWFKLILRAKHGSVLIGLS